MLKIPEQDLKFLARATALIDPMASQTKVTPLTGSARGQMVNRATLLDLWAEKDFTISGQSAHVRIGKQVINWGESLYATGGVNATNSVDIQTLLIPGTQLKQALLPAPMASFATNLPMGFSTEAYVQVGWNANRYPAVGSYWSLSDNVGRGAVPALSDSSNFNQAGLDPSTALPYTTIQPSNRPQYGVRFGYTPPGQSINLAAYYENYSDKNPVFGSIAGGTVMAAQYLTKRELFGASVNFPIGLWSIGAEISYRPHDAVAMSGCLLNGGTSDFNANGATGNCNSWKDNKKYQFIINAQQQISETSQPTVMKLLGGADTAIFTAELSYINYPGIDEGKHIQLPLQVNLLTRFPQPAILYG